ncbi:MAG: hypothetical protein ACRDQX_05830 [Pseudonocardiaceae bacterium]
MRARDIEPGHTCARRHNGGYLPEPVQVTSVGAGRVHYLDGDGRRGHVPLAGILCRREPFTAALRRADRGAGRLCDLDGWFGTVYPVYAGDRVGATTEQTFGVALHLRCGPR